MFSYRTLYLFFNFSILLIDLLDINSVYLIFLRRKFEMWIKKKLVLVFVIVFYVNVIFYGSEVLDVIKAGDVKKLEKLLSQDPGLIKVDEKKGQALLHRAASLGEIKIAELLINKGAKVDSFYHQKNTPFTFAAYSGKVEVAKLLLSKGANLNYRNQIGETALIFAVRNRHSKFIDFLLNNKVNIDKDIEIKKLDAHLVAKAGNVRLMDILFKKGIKTNVYKKTGDTFLHSTAIGGMTKYIEKIIKEGVNINIKNYYGYTPIHGAAKAGNIDAVKALIKNGADIKLRTYSGESVYSFAEKSKNKELLEYLNSIKMNELKFKYPLLKGKYIDNNLPGRKSRLYAPGIISTHDGFEFAGTFSPDGKNYYFTRRLNGKQRIIWTNYKNDHWTKPELAPSPLSYPDAHEFEPSISPDGKRMFFGSWRPLPGKKVLNHTYDIWYSDKTENGWAEPVFFEPGMMYITSTIKGKIYFNFYSDKSPEENGIYYRERDGRGYKQKIKVSNVINGMKHAAHPYIAKDESYLIFDSKIKKYVGDLFISFRNTDKSWSKPINMGTEINGKGSVMTASLSSDEKYLFFYRNGDIYWISASIIDDLKRKWKNKK